MAIPGADSGGSGLEKLKADAVNISARLALPLLAISQGAKVSAVALGLVKGAILTKVLGPLALVSGAATGLLASLRLVAGAFGRLGIEGARNLERLEKSFQPLLRSAALARQRVRELNAFAKVTPFKSESVIAANRSLELFTKGAYSNIRAMKLVGDAAAYTGNDITDVAGAVGKLYGEIQNGAPLGRAIRQLVGMGVISAETAERVENLKNAGVGASQVWAVLEQDMQRSGGAMLAMQKSLAGLEEQYDSAKKALITGFGAGFMAGEKKSLEGQIEVLQRLAPVTQFYGEILGRVQEGFGGLERWVLRAIGAIPGLVPVLKGAGVAVTGLLASISALAVVRIGGFIANILALAAGFRLTAQAQANSARVATLLAEARGRLALAGRSLMAGNVALAASHGVEAAALTASAAKVDKQITALQILTPAARKAGSALLLVGRAALGMVTALLTTPIGWVVAGLTALVTVSVLAWNAHQKHKEVLRELAQATRDANNAFREQFGLMKTLADKSELYRRATDRLIEAERKLAAARREGDRDKIRLAQREITDAQRNRELVARADNGRLALTPEENERRREIRRAFRRPDYVATKEQFDAELAAQEQTRAELAAEAQGREDQRLSLERLKERIDENARQQVEAGRMIGRINAPGSTILNKAELTGKWREEQARLEQEALFLAKEYYPKQEQFAAENILAASAAMGRSGSELMREQGVLDTLYRNRDAYGRAEAARRLVENIASTEQKELAGLATEGMAPDLAFLLKKGDQRSALGLAKTAWQAADEENRRFNPSGQVDFAAIQEQENRVADLREKFDAAAVKQADEARRAAGWDEKRAALEKMINSLRDDGLASELERFRLKEQELALEREALAANRTMLAEEKTAAGARLDAQEAANRTARANLERELIRRKAAAVDEFRLNQSSREMREARRRGDTAGYGRAQREGEETAARQRERELREEARGLFAGEPEREAYVKQRLEEFRKQQALEKSEREEEERNRRVDIRRGENAQVLQLRANLLRKRGRSAEAKELEEEAAQVMDESRRRDLVREYRASGLSAEEAGLRADNQIRLDRANRELARQENFAGKVIASSTAAIGGGGGVGGLDPMVNEQKRTNQLLEEIRRATGGNIDWRNEEQ
ncbi:MAG: hypothetical protein LBH01_02050 [Verrucomicrobiales bacterium]|jgi:hypothetical protein|nr:hypothetical protein [Verrucomicrobiales bacterium]